jgi:hypothetical protein
MLELEAVAARAAVADRAADAEHVGPLHVRAQADEGQVAFEAVGVAVRLEVVAAVLDAAVDRRRRRLARVAPLMPKNWLLRKLLWLS